MLYLAFQQFKTQVETFKFTDVRTREVMLLLAKVFAFAQLAEDHGCLYETGFFSVGSQSLMDEAFKKALIQLRPHMVNLVELNYDSMMDGSHLSAIGNEYGDIYEEQLDRAMKGKFNSLETHNKPDYFDELCLPFYNQTIRSKL